MKIIKILTYKIPERNFFNTVLNFFAPFVLIPFALIMLLIVIPIMWIYDKIKTNILGIKPTQHLKTENILFSDENFHLIKEYYDPVDESKENEPLYEFFWNLAEYDDEFLIFKTIDKKRITELNDCYITDFEFKSGNNILLQKLSVKNNEVKSYLIDFNIENGKVEILYEIGNFVLTKYDKKKNSIIGYNQTDKVEIKIQP